MTEADIEITKTIDGTERVLGDGIKVRLDAVYEPFFKWTTYYVVVYRNEMISKMSIYEYFDENEYAMKGQIVPYLKTKVMEIYDSFTK